MEREHDFWMDDGNVVLSAVQNRELVTASGEAAPTIRLFRCHKSVLAMHSTIFRDTFALAQSTEAEQYEGIPLICLPDEADDVKTLLQVLYDPTRLIRIDGSMLNERGQVVKRDLPSVDGLLRLAKKYDCAAIYEHMSALVRKLWPGTVRLWEDLISQGLVARVDLTTARVDETTRPDFARLFRLAREAHVPEILPAVYYELNIWCGWPSLCQIESSVRDNKHALSMEFLESLETQELVRFIAGRQWLQGATMQLCTVAGPEILRGRMGKCREELPGNDMIQRWTDACAEVMKSPGTTLFVNPLAGFDEIRSELRDANMCQSCRKLVFALAEACKQYLWRRLSAAFNLGQQQEQESQGETTMEAQVEEFMP